MAQAVKAELSKAMTGFGFEVIQVGCHPYLNFKSLKALQPVHVGVIDCICAYLSSPILRQWGNWGLNKSNKIGVSNKIGCHQSDM